MELTKATRIEDVIDDLRFGHYIAFQQFVNNSLTEPNVAKVIDRENMPNRSVSFVENQYLKLGLNLRTTTQNIFNGHMAGDPHIKTYLLGWWPREPTEEQVVAAYRNAITLKTMF